MICDNGARIYVNGNARTRKNTRNFFGMKILLKILPLKKNYF